MSQLHGGQLRERDDKLLSSSDFICCQEPFDPWLLSGDCIASNTITAGQPDQHCRHQVNNLPAFHTGEVCHPYPEISPPSDRFSLHILNTATACGERKGHLAVVNVSFCVFVFIETVFKCLQISYHADVTSKKEKKKRMAERNYSSGMCNREIQIHSCRPVVQPGAAWLMADVILQALLQISWLCVYTWNMKKRLQLIINLFSHIFSLHWLLAK